MHRGAKPSICGSVNIRIGTLPCIQLLFSLGIRNSSDLFRDNFWWTIVRGGLSLKLNAPFKLNHGFGKRTRQIGQNSQK